MSGGEIAEIRNKLGLTRREFVKEIKNRGYNKIDAAYYEECEIDLEMQPIELDKLLREIMNTIK